MKRLALSLCVLCLLFPGVAMSATYYVNGSGAPYVGNQGTYGIGNDSTGNGTLATPYATMVKVETVAAASGDTAYVAAGIYPEASSVGAGSGCITFNKGTAWIADGTVTLHRASGTTLAMFTGTAATSWTGFVFDGENTVNYVMLGQSAPQSNKTWTNCTFKNGYGSSILLRFYSTAGTNNVVNNSTFTGPAGTGILSDNSPVVLNNPTFSGITTSSANFVDVSNTANSVTITGGTATLTGTQMLVKADGCTGALSVTGMTINTSSTSAAISKVFGSMTSAGNMTISGNIWNISGLPTLASILLSDITGNATVQSNNVTYSGASAAASSWATLTDVRTPSIDSNSINNPLYTNLSPIMVLTGGQAFTGMAHIGYNIIITDNTGGYVIGLGNEVPGTANANCNRYDGSSIIGNHIYGPIWMGTHTSASTHAIFVGHQAGVNVSYNLAWGSGYGAVIKGTGTDWAYAGGIYRNLFIDNAFITGPLFKGVLNVPAYNNTVLAEAAYPPSSGALVYAENNGAGIGATGLHWCNNIILGGATSDIFIIDPDSAVGFAADHNIYYNYDGNASTQAFSFNGNALTGMVNWVAATGDTSLFSAPQFINAPNNLGLLSGSAAIASGIFVAGSFTDYFGIALKSPPDIGAIQFDAGFAF